MATWLKLTGTGLLGAFIIAGCTITTNPDDDDDFDDDFGEAGSSPRAGAGSGGRAGSGAGGARAGGGAGGSRAGAGGSTAGTGGSPPDDGLPDDLECGGEATEPAPRCEFGGAAPGYADCQECLVNNCCDEVRNCYGEEPSDACGWGGEDGVPEWLCYIGCIVETVEVNGVYSPDDAETCAFDCGTQTDGLGNACDTPLISNNANALVSCMHDTCEQECVYDVVDAG